MASLQSSALDAFHASAVNSSWRGSSQQFEEGVGGGEASLGCAKALLTYLPHSPLAQLLQEPSTDSEPPLPSHTACREAHAVTQEDALASSGCAMQLFQKSTEIRHSNT
ncbi:hypothetical protein DPEC_G00163540 [Dallia pectoralis]|uniref:Uncharacterized protein n=1 Tax=Dallia pectoralis TaxID=75939 RepID=A0ACC2GGL6_DALPE|nr:hypothetical protein DPEC_G00163540 [Dallia pectoralis]